MNPYKVTALSAAGILALSGCGMDVSNRVLPGAKGSGDDGYEVTVELDDVGNLVTNGEVKVNDKTVGTVKRITLDGWRAVVTIGIENDIKLPANVEARIGQKSLLGSEYVELSAPAQNASTQSLRNGAFIPVARTGRYTDTEDLLSTLSLWLNGGGLQHIQTITTEVNLALSGNEQEARNLITNLDRFISGLDEQKNQIVSAIRSVNELSKRLAVQRDKLGTALEQFPAGLQTLNRQRENLTGALAALDDLSSVSTRVVRTSGKNLRDDLTNLQPALREINKAADSLPDVLDVAGTVLFPVKAVPNVVKGDYLNASVTADITNDSIASGFLPNTPVAQAIGLLQTALQASNPLTGPLTDGVNDLTDGITIGAEDQTTPGTGTSKPAPTTPTPTSPPTPNNPLGSLLSGLLGGGR